MRLLFERNDPQIYESNAQRAARMRTYMSTATPELADKLGSARTTYNWVNPGILTSMELSNNEPALQEVAKVVGEKPRIRAAIVTSANTFLKGFMRRRFSRRVQ